MCGTSQVRYKLTGERDLLSLCSLDSLEEAELRLEVAQEFRWELFQQPQPGWSSLRRLTLSGCVLPAGFPWC